MSWDNHATPSDAFSSVYHERKNECNSTVRDYITAHLPKPKLTPELIAAKFREELDDFCGTHGVEYQISSDGYVVLHTQSILNVEVTA